MRSILRWLRDPVTWLSIVQTGAAIANIYERRMVFLATVVLCSGAIVFIVVRRILKARRENREWRAAMRRQLNAWRN